MNNDFFNINRQLWVGKNYDANIEVTKERFEDAIEQMLYGNYKYHQRYMNSILKELLDV